MRVAMCLAYRKEAIAVCIPEAISAHTYTTDDDLHFDDFVPNTGVVSAYAGMSKRAATRYCAKPVAVEHCESRLCCKLMTCKVHGAAQQGSQGIG